MPRRIFYSFDFKADSHRVAKVKNLGVFEAQRILTPNKWEDVKAGGDKAIRRWIRTEMYGKSCVVVLLGTGTTGRRWVDYEIAKAWNDGRGLLGVHIHRITDLNGTRVRKGANPFREFAVGGRKVRLDTIVKTYDPQGTSSAEVLARIKTRLPMWVEQAIRIRNDFGG